MNSSVINTKVYKQVLHAVQGPIGGNMGYRFINEASGIGAKIAKASSKKAGLTAKEIAAITKPTARKEAMSELANMTSGVNKTIINKPPTTVSRQSITDSINRAKEYEKAMRVTKNSKINPLDGLENLTPNKVIKSSPKQQVSSRIPKTEYTQSYSPKYSDNVLVGSGKVIKAKDTISDVNPMESFVRTQMYLNKKNSGAVIKSYNIINDSNREMLKQQFTQQMNYRFMQQFNGYNQ